MDPANLLSRLEQKYNDASGPWKWGIGGLILVSVVAMIAYYIYRWMIFTVNQDERALRKTFGIISMEFDNPEMKETAKPYRKAKDIIGSDPTVLESFGRAKVCGPGRHWKFFGVHGYIPINVRPRNFEFELYIQRDHEGRYNSFTAKVTVVVKVENILRWHMANYEPEQLIGTVLRDGFRQVKANPLYGSKMFEATGDRMQLKEVIANVTHEEIVRLGGSVDNLFMDLPEERTDTMMPEVIYKKDFMQGLLDFMRSTIENTGHNGAIVVKVT